MIKVGGVIEFILEGDTIHKKIILTVNAIEKSITDPLERTHSTTAICLNR
jgi:hypothetical protein